MIKSNNKNIEYINQNPIGRSSRSNPITYLKAYDDIRHLFANQKLSISRGYKPRHFSFNVEGGRCENCKGDGQIIIEMQFMADVVLECTGAYNSGVECIHHTINGAKKVILRALGSPVMK